MDIKNINAIDATTNIQQNPSSMQNQRDNISSVSKQEFDIQNLPKDKKDEFLDKIAKDLSEKFKLFNNQLKIEIDKDTGKEVVKIIDSKTKEVIRQIPPEELLKVAKYIDEITGILFKDKA